MRTTRHDIKNAKRLVIKIGSSSLTCPDGSLNLEQIHILVDSIIKARTRGQEVVLVSSGSMAAGMSAIELDGRPRDISAHQAASMVGQSRLISAYQKEFSRSGISVGQVLLTTMDIENRRHYINAHESIHLLLSFGVVPIVNENDAVVTDEVRFGDNDRLAALTSHLIDADALILLTDVDGLYDAPPSHGGSRLISVVDDFSQLENLSITSRGSVVGTGGMLSKVRAAHLATHGGVGVLLTRADLIGKALDTGDVGTWFVPQKKRESARSLWLAHAAQAQGKIIVDDGAVRALSKKRVSVLPVGVVGVAGRFSSGDLVEVVGMDGDIIARGITALSSVEVARLAGGDNDDNRGLAPVIHANDLVRM
ncbi:MAG: glutamate 5-kinase [Actinomycetaceae bacterium]|nr:glutamate 5-kinase [Actinomycetaceae bacterium]